MGLIDRAKDWKSKVSGNVSFGSNQSSGYVPVIIAVGFIAFMVGSFGGLFSKRKRRR